MHININELQPADDMNFTRKKYIFDHILHYSYRERIIYNPNLQERLPRTGGIVRRPPKEVDRHKYLGLRFRMKGFDTGRIYEVGIARAVRTASLFN